MAEQNEARECGCPYCDKEFAAGKAAFCMPCEVVIVRCAHCGEPVRDGVETCPHCGEPCR